METLVVFLAGGNLLKFQSGFAIWVAISLVLFLFVMYKYAVPPIMNALEERESGIRDSLEAAEKALAKAEQVGRENEAILREAELKAQQIRKEAVQEAEAIRSERVEKAKAEAAKLLEDAREAIEQEKKRAMSDLRREVSQLAIEASGRILRENMDTERNKKIVTDFIGDLSEN